MAGLQFGKRSREKAGGTGKEGEAAPLAKARSTRQAAQGKGEAEKEEEKRRDKGERGGAPFLSSAYASRTKRQLRGRGPSHPEQNPSGRKEGKRGGGGKDREGNEEERETRRQENEAGGKRGEGLRKKGNEGKGAARDI